MATKSPFFSIVTVTRNDLVGLKKTINSVLLQTVNVELIVVDGASDDPKVKEYLEGLRVSKHSLSWESRRDRGLYHAMNKGLSKVSGKYVLFLNSSDTLVNSHVLEEVQAAIEEKRSEWAVGIAIRLDESGRPVGVWEYLDHSEWGLALGFRTFCHQSVFYKSELIKDFTYDEDLLCADHLMNLKFYKDFPVTTMPIVTTYFQNGGISSKRSIRDTSNDLREARKRSDSLILGNSFLDALIFMATMLLLRSNGALWVLLRRLLPKLVRVKFGAHVEKRS
jgi:glycosyltransferase involved in cell wall biosynthesis